MQIVIRQCHRGRIGFLKINYHQCVNPLVVPSFFSFLFFLNNSQQQRPKRKQPTTTAQRDTNNPLRRSIQTTKGNEKSNESN